MARRKLTVHWKLLTTDHMMKRDILMVGEPKRTPKIGNSHLASSNFSCFFPKFERNLRLRSKVSQPTNTTNTTYHQKKKEKKKKKPVRLPSGHPALVGRPSRQAKKKRLLTRKTKNKKENKKKKTKKENKKRKQKKKLFASRCCDVIIKNWGYKREKKEELNSVQVL